jgi:hypothetical protein
MELPPSWRFVIGATPEWQGLQISLLAEPQKTRLDA